MKLLEVKEALKAEVLYGEDRLADMVRAAGGADLIDDIKSSRAKGSVLLTGLNSLEVMIAAREAKVAAIVFVRGKKPAPEVLEKAEKFGIPLLLTRFSLFVACGRLYMTGLRGLDGSW